MSRISLVDPDLNEKLGLPEGQDINFQTESAPENDETLTGVNADGDLVVAYLSLDPYRGEYDWGAGAQGIFEEFSDQKSRDERMAELSAEGKYVFIVDNYRHSLDHYSVEGTRNYPDRQWDVAPRALYCPPDDVAKDYFDGRTSREDLVKFANSVLDEYSNWRNGDVHGVCVEVFRKPDNLDEDGWDLINNDACWGYIGYTDAKQVLQQEFDAAIARGEAPSDTPEPGI